MFAIHFICKRDDGVTLNGVKRDGATGNHRSGQWDISDDDARSLVGGWLYLHPTKADRSEFGGVIVGYEPVVDKQLAHAERIVLLIEKRREGSGQRWRGKSHGMAYSSGLVSADLEHEKGTDA